MTMETSMLTNEQLEPEAQEPVAIESTASVQGDASSRPGTVGEATRNRPWSKHRLSRIRSQKHHHHHHRHTTVTCQDGSKVVINLTWLKEWLVDLEHMNDNVRTDELDTLLHEIHSSETLDPDVVHELLMCLPAREAMRFKTMAATTMNAVTTTTSALNHEYIDFAVEHTFQRLQAQAEGRWVATPSSHGSMPASRGKLVTPEPAKPVFHFLLDQFDKQIEAAKKIQRAFRLFKQRCDKAGWPSGAPPAHLAKTAAHTKARYLEVFNRSKQPVKDRQQLKEVFAAKLFDKMRAKASKSATTTQNGAATVAEPVQQMTEEEMLALAEAQAERLAKQAERDRRAAAKLAARQARVLAKQIAREERREARREVKRQEREKVLRGKVARAQLRKIESLKVHLEQAVLNGTVPIKPVTTDAPALGAATADSLEEAVPDQASIAEAVPAEQPVSEGAEPSNEPTHDAANELTNDSTHNTINATSGTTNEANAETVEGDANRPVGDEVVEADGNPDEAAQAAQAAGEPTPESHQPSPGRGALTVLIPDADPVSMPEPAAELPSTNPWAEATLESFQRIGITAAHELLQRLAQDAQQQLQVLSSSSQAGFRSGFASRAVSGGGYLTDKRAYAGSPANGPVSPTRAATSKSPVRGRTTAGDATSPNSRHRSRAGAVAEEPDDDATPEERAARRAELQRLAKEFAPYMSADEEWSGSEVSLSSTDSSSSSSSSSSSYMSSTDSDDSSGGRRKSKRKQRESIPSGPAMSQKLDLQGETDPLKKAVMVGQGMLSKDLYRNLGRGETATPSPRLAAAQRKAWDAGDGTQPRSEGTDGATASDASDAGEVVDKPSGGKVVVGMLSSLQQEATPTQPMHKSGLNMLHHILFRDGLELIGSMALNDAASRQAVLKAKVEQMVSQRMNQVRRELGLKEKRESTKGISRGNSRGGSRANSRVGSRAHRRSHMSTPDNATSTPDPQQQADATQPAADAAAPSDCDEAVYDLEEALDDADDEAEGVDVDEGDRQVLKELIATALAEELATAPENAAAEPESDEQPAADAGGEAPGGEGSHAEAPSRALTLGEALGLDVGTDVQQIEAKIVAAIQDEGATAATMAAMERQQLRAEDRRAKRRTRKAERLAHIAREGPGEASDDASQSKSQVSTRNRSTLNYLHPASQSQISTPISTPPPQRGAKTLRSSVRTGRSPDQAKLMTEQMVQLQKQAMRLANKQVTILPTQIVPELSAGSAGGATSGASTPAQPQSEAGYASPTSKLPNNLIHQPPALGSSRSSAGYVPGSLQLPVTQSYNGAPSPLGIRMTGYQQPVFNTAAHSAQSTMPPSPSAASAPGSPTSIASGLPPMPGDRPADMVTPPEVTSRRRQLIHDREYDSALARELFMRHARQHKLAQPGQQASVKPIMSMGEAADYLAAVQLAEARAWNSLQPLPPSVAISLQTARLHSAVFQSVASNVWSRHQTQDGTDANALSAGIQSALETVLQTPADALDPAKSYSDGNQPLLASAHTTSVLNSAAAAAAAKAVPVQHSSQAGTVTRQAPAAAGQPADEVDASQLKEQRRHRRRHKHRHRKDNQQQDEAAAAGTQGGGDAAEHRPPEAADHHQRRRRHHRHRHHNSTEQQDAMQDAAVSTANAGDKLPILMQDHSQDRSSRSALGASRTLITSADSVRSWLESSESFLRKGSKRGHQRAPGGSEANTSTTRLPMLRTTQAKAKLQNLDAYYNSLLAHLSAVPPQAQASNGQLASAQDNLGSAVHSHRHAWELHERGGMVTAVASASIVRLVGGRPPVSAGSNSLKSYARAGVPVSSL